MNEKFSKRLTEYLNSETDNYSMEYTWEWDEDMNCCVATIQDQYDQSRFKQINFRYDEAKDELKIELCEDSYYATREFDETVKYFWMLVSPALFPNN